MPSLLARRLSSEPQTADLPRLLGATPLPPWETTALPPVRGEVALLEGCAMSVLYPHVHEATERLLRRVGFETVRVPGCCGALHAHNGHLSHARDMALDVAAKARRPLIVNAAGCGSWLKEAVGPGVQDATEFLFDQGLGDALRSSTGFDGLTAVYQDACHLSHGQGVRSQPRALLQAVPGLTLAELSDPGLCCGSGGIYNILQPSRARRMLDAKWADIAATKAQVAVTGNPGCHGWIAQAAREDGGHIEVVHTLSLLEASFSGF
jgi:glycolate oxidase iron-sulfur subunit